MRGLARLLRPDGDRLLEVLDRADEMIDGEPRRPRALIHAKIAHGARQPVFEVGVKAVLRLPRLEVEEAEHQRAREAEERRRERDAHAAERSGKSALQILENRAGVPAHLQRLNNLADRTHGFEQPPEGAEQAEEDEEPGEIPGDVA